MQGFDAVLSKMETTDSSQNDSSMNLAPKQKSKLKGSSAASGNLYAAALIF